MRGLACHFWWTGDLSWSDSFHTPHFCDLTPVLCSVAFRSSFIRSLLLDLDPYGENNPDGMFSFFYKPVARELALKFGCNFRHLVKGGSFPACWRIADVVPVPKRFLFSEVGDYRPISITPLLLKIFEKIVAGKPSIFFKVTICFLFLSFCIVRACEHVML